MDNDGYLIEYSWLSGGHISWLNGPQITYPKPLTQEIKRHGHPHCLKVPLHHNIDVFYNLSTVPSLAIALALVAILVIGTFKCQLAN